MTENGWFACELRVRYEETDQMKVVYHANYLPWMEIGRTELIRALGYPYREVERRGLYLPVVDVQVAYKKPAYYDDVVTVLTRVSELTPLRVTFDYEVRRSTGPVGGPEGNGPEDELLVTGVTRHVWVNAQFKPVRADKAAPDLYERLLSLKQ